MIKKIEECLNVFNHFKETHFISSGKNEIHENWDIMYQMLLNGNARLFTLNHQKTFLLFVGGLKLAGLSKCRGMKKFSQHLLEWNIIKF